MPSASKSRLTTRRRTRTPSDIKWLLTERAHVEGELRQLEQHKSFLAKKLEYVTRQQARILTLLAEAEDDYSRKKATVAAIDHSLRILAPAVNPGAGGVLKPKLNRFGPLGSLKAFLIKELKEALPEPLTTTELVDKAIDQFSIEVYAPEVRRAARRTMLVLLKRMQRQGFIESLYAKPPEYSGIWRWIADRAPSLAELRVFERKVEDERICET